jgi:hypothetical protein
MAVLILDEVERLPVAEKVGRTLLAVRQCHSVEQCARNRLERAVRVERRAVAAPYRTKASTYQLR